MAYKGFKALLDVLETVGYAVPPMKAVAAGLSKVLALIDICTAMSQWMTVWELIIVARMDHGETGYRFLRAQT